MKHLWHRLPSELLQSILTALSSPAFHLFALGAQAPTPAPHFLFQPSQSPPGADLPTKESMLITPIPFFGVISSCS